MLHTDFHSKPLERDSMILIKAFFRQKYKASFSGKKTPGFF